MPNAVKKIPLSASVQGMGIKVAAIATPGTLIHTTGTGNTDLDELWVYAYNSNTVNETLTLEIGDATAPDHNLVNTIPPQQGDLLLIAGRILTGSGTVAATVRAFAADANRVILSGYVNRITP
jgi:hypothetical protein